MYSVSRYHDISCGHRVVGQGGKCEHLHGHNYRVTFHCRPTSGLDHVGRVLDFDIIKGLLCYYIELNWDHRFIVWSDDPWAQDLHKVDEKVYCVPFNPTAENMAKYLVMTVGPDLLQGTGVVLYRVDVEETRKCVGSFELDTK